MATIEAIWTNYIRPNSKIASRPCVIVFRMRRPIEAIITNHPDDTVVLIYAAATHEVAQNNEFMLVIFGKNMLLRA